MNVVFDLMLFCFIYIHQVMGNAAFIVKIMALNGNLLVAFFIFCNIAEITSHQVFNVYNYALHMPKHYVPRYHRQGLIFLFR